MLLKKEKVAPKMNAFGFSQSSPVEIGAHFEQFYHLKDDAKKNVNLYLLIIFALAAESRAEKESITRQKQEPSYLSAKCRTAEDEQNNSGIQTRQIYMTKASRKTAKSGARETKNSGKMCCDRNLTRLRRAWKHLKS